MALLDAELTILKIELDTDPNGLGYSNITATACAVLLNAVSVFNSIDVSVLDGQEFSKAVIISEYNNLNNVERQGWATILSAGNGQIDISDQRVIDQIAVIWGSGTVTRANLLALKTRDGSRVEAIFRPGVSIDSADVAEARLL